LTSGEASEAPGLLAIRAGLSHHPAMPHKAPSWRQRARARALEIAIGVLIAAALGLTAAALLGPGVARPGH
jgi:hypothetical protein